MLAMGPRVLNSAPCSPCWYTRNFFLQSDACHGSQGREFCTLQPLLVHQEFFFSSLMLAMGPRVLNSAPCSPCWYTRNVFFLV